MTAKAEADQEYIADAGAYSIVYLRRLVGGEVGTTILVNSFIADGDESTYVDASAVAAVADLNLDGRMEIVVDGSYGEGVFLLVFERVDDLGPVQVMSCGCGL